MANAIEKQRQLDAAQKELALAEAALTARANADRALAAEADAARAKVEAAVVAVRDAPRAEAVAKVDRAEKEAGAAVIEVLAAVKALGGIVRKARTAKDTADTLRRAAGQAVSGRDSIADYITAALLSAGVIDSRALAAPANVVRRLGDVNEVARIERDRRLEEERRLDEERRARDPQELQRALTLVENALRRYRVRSDVNTRNVRSRIQEAEGERDSLIARLAALGVEVEAA